MKLEVKSLTLQQWIVDKKIKPTEQLTEQPTEHIPTYPNSHTSVIRFKILKNRKVVFQKPKIKKAHE